MINNIALLRVSISLYKDKLAKVKELGWVGWVNNRVIESPFGRYGIPLGPGNCPLCNAYFLSCRECPIGGCYRSPYADLESYVSCRPRIIWIPKLRKLLRAQLEFLEDVLVTEIQAKIQECQK